MSKAIEIQLDPETEKGFLDSVQRSCDWAFEYGLIRKRLTKSELEIFHRVGMRHPKATVWQLARYAMVCEAYAEAGQEIAGNPDHPKRFNMLYKRYQRIGRYRSQLERELGPKL